VQRKRNPRRHRADAPGARGRHPAGHCRDVLRQPLVPRYLITDANGLTGNETLAEGSTLAIPIRWPTAPTARRPSRSTTKARSSAPPAPRSHHQEKEEVIPEADRDPDRGGGVHGRGGAGDVRGRDRGRRQRHRQGLATLLARGDGSTTARTWPSLSRTPGWLWHKQGPRRNRRPRGLGPKRPRSKGLGL
jgi:hypothetical protein